MDKILLTGASGFLGEHIKMAIQNPIITLGRKSNNSIVCDLSTQIPNIRDVDIVIHAAGKAHCVSNSKAQKQNFYDVNVNGTQNLIEGLSNLIRLPRSFVYISSVAVYGLQSGTMINESQPLEAWDPYGRSKILAENLIREWCGKNNIICTILRLPLIVGDSPPGNLGAMIRGIKSGYYVNIGGGRARKSMVLVEDIANILLKASLIGGVYNLTDGYHPSFSELSHAIAVKFNKSKPINVSKLIIEPIAWFGSLVGEKFPINKNKLDKLTKDLTFDDSHARKMLDWSPKQILKNI